MNLAELISLLRAAEIFEDIDSQKDEIIDFIPQVRIMIGFDQKHIAHQYDLWEHSVRTLLELPKDADDDMLYLAALLHDIGKPDCQTSELSDGKVRMHYYGHPEKSMETVRDEIIPELLNKGEQITEEQQKRLLYYIRYHDDRMSLHMKHLRQHLNMGADLITFQNLMKLQVADAKAHIQIPVVMERIEICSKLSGEYAEELYCQILAGK